MEKNKSKTILFSIVGSVILAASIIFFVLGIINLSVKKSSPSPKPAASKLYALNATEYTTTYKVDDQFTFDGKCYALYTDNTSKLVAPTYTAPDMTVKGNKEITLSYTEGDITVDYKYSISVGLNEPILYALSANGYKTEYELNETFTFDGECRAIYTNSDETKVVTPTYTAPDMSTKGGKDVVLSYTEGDITVTYTYSIYVKEANPTLLAITASNYTVEYDVDSEFEFDGVCLAIYTNSEETKLVTPTYTAPDMSAEGIKQVTLSYTEGEVTATYTYSIYVGVPYDAEEAAKDAARVDLIEAQEKLAYNPVGVSSWNLKLDYQEDYFLSDDIYSYEYFYFNNYGRQHYSESLVRNDDTYVRRFVDNRFVGFTYVGDDSRSYIQSKMVYPTLDASELKYHSNNGETSVFTTESEEMNKFYAFYSHSEYDESNLLSFEVSIMNEANQVFISPIIDNIEDAYIITLGLLTDSNYYSDYCNSYYDIQNKRYNNTPDYNDYINLTGELLPADDTRFEKYYVKPADGVYSYSANNYYRQEADREFYTIGFVECGDAVQDYIDNVLLVDGYTLVDGKYVKDDDRHLSGDDYDSTYEHRVTVEFDNSNPNFSNGVMRVIHERGIKQ